MKKSDVKDNLLVTEFNSIYKECPEVYRWSMSKLNQSLNGMELDRVTIVTASTNQGKTIVVSNEIMGAMRANLPVFVYFGEDTRYEALERLFSQIVGGNKENYEYVKRKLPNGEDAGFSTKRLTREAWGKAMKEVDGKLVMFNNNNEATLDTLLEKMKVARREHNCRLMVLDNAEMFSLENIMDMNEAMKRFSINLRLFAQKEGVHIIIVVHIRKYDRGVLELSEQDVKGSSSLTNLAKNIILVQRTDGMDCESKEYKRLMEKVRLDIKKNNENQQDAKYRTSEDIVDIDYKPKFQVLLTILKTKGPHTYKYIPCYYNYNSKQIGQWYKPNDGFEKHEVAIVPKMDVVESSHEGM